jgi:hypothetical protein
MLVAQGGSSLSNVCGSFVSSFDGQLKNSSNKALQDAHWHEHGRTAHGEGLVIEDGTLPNPGFWLCSD